MQYDEKEQDVHTFKKHIKENDSKIAKADQEKMRKKDLILKDGADIHS